MPTGYESASDFLVDGVAVDKAKLRAYLLANEKVELKRFGAVLNGVVDDTTVFQTAAAAVGDAGGGTLEVGTFDVKITEAIPIQHSNVHIALAGATILNYAPNPGDWAFVINNQAEDLENIAIGGGIIKNMAYGSGITIGEQHGSALTNSNVNGVLFYDLEIQDPHYAGITSSGDRCDGVTLHNVLVTGCGDPAVTGCVGIDMNSLLGGENHAYTGRVRAELAYDAGPESQAFKLNKVKGFGRIEGIGCEGTAYAVQLDRVAGDFQVVGNARGNFGCVAVAPGTTTGKNATLNLAWSGTTATGVSSIAVAGTGYRPGDEISPAGGTLGGGSHRKARIRVLRTSGGTTGYEHSASGGIVEVELVDGGKYSVVPSNPAPVASSMGLRLSGGAESQASSSRIALAISAGAYSCPFDLSNFVSNDGELRSLGNVTTFPGWDFARCRFSAVVLNETGDDLSYINISGLRTQRLVLAGDHCGVRDLVLVGATANNAAELIGNSNRIDDYDIVDPAVYGIVVSGAGNIIGDGRIVGAGANPVRILAGSTGTLLGEIRTAGGAGLGIDDAGTGTLPLGRLAPHPKAAAAAMLGFALGPNLGNSPQIFVGTGSPEGVVTAIVGSIYIRSNGGAGTVLYVKETGSGNTGWAAK